ncbi:MAG: lipoprotein [Pseudomonadota bacterium]
MASRLHRPTFFVLIAASLMLAACGRSGPLELPEGVTEVTPPPASDRVPDEGDRPSEPFILDGLL